MNQSLQAKIIIPITLLIAFISLVSTYLFIDTYRKNIGRELIARGTALSYSLSKAAEEGLVQENLDLIKKAAYIIHAEDVVLVQVYSNIWDAIDAYPFDRLKDAPNPDAVKHFEVSTSPVHIKYNSTYDFYSPILFTTIENSPPLPIGFVRISLSASHMHKEIRQAVYSNIVVSILITLFSIAVISIVINRFVISRVKSLQGAIAAFKSGVLPDTQAAGPNDEIGNVFSEFARMSSEIKEKGDKLAESEKRMSSLFERVEHAVFRADRKGRITEKNITFAAMFGNVKELCDILADPDKCPLKEIGEKILHSEQKVFDRNGAELTILLSLYAEKGDDGEVKSFDGYILDITEQKNLEEALQHSRKMEAVGTLAGGVAHDFNNMLQGILGYASFMKEKLSETDPMYKPVSVIEHSAKRAADLTKQLLGFARGGKYIIRPVDLNNAMENVVNILSRTFDKAIEINLVTAEGLWKVEADQSQMEHVALNLCINARDAMPSGGVLRIETLNYEGKPPVPSAGPGKYAVMKISDTGVGINKKILQRIFEPFFTTKEIGKGTGMGLAMAYGVIENHSGFITVESNEGRGSTFTVYLPATEKSEGPSVEITKEDTFVGKGTVLVVDDEDIIRDLAIEVLSQYGYEVLSAADGHEAVEIYSRIRDDIDIVILDMIMPRMGGKEAFEKLRAINPDVKVLLSSGYSLDDAARAILQDGARGFIQKPFDIDKLAKQIEAVCS